MIAQTLQLLDPFDESRALFDQIVVELQSDDTATWDHYQLETWLQQQGHELMSRHLQGQQAHIDKRGPGQMGPAVLGGDDFLRTHKRITSRHLETIFGTVLIERIAYQAPALSSVHPKDASLNLPKQKQSHALTKRLALESARGSYDEAVNSTNQNTGAHIAKRQAEELAVRAA